MYTFFRDFFDCLSRAAAFSNIGNLGDALRALAESHPDEIELPPADRQTLGKPVTAQAGDTTQNPSPVSVVF